MTGSSFFTSSLSDEIDRADRSVFGSMDVAFDRKRSFVRALSTITERLHRKNIQSLLSPANPILYAYLADCLTFILATPPSSQESRERALQAISDRLKLFQNWNLEGNVTARALFDGKLTADDVRMHTRRPVADYQDFYDEQNKGLANRVTRSQRRSDNPPAARLLRVTTEPRPNVNHYFRQIHAVTVIESLCGLHMKLRPDEEVIWIDIACGTGEIANGADPGRFAKGTWRVVGVDFQSAKIDMANSHAALNRTFLAGDALNVADEILSQQHKRIGVVSMCEFLEHLEDPAAFVARLRNYGITFIMAASPLEQRFAKPLNGDPDRVHLWSYSRTGFEKLLSLSGGEPIYSSETRVGTYLNGLDWLTVVVGPQDEMRAMRKSFLERRGISDEDDR